MAKLGRKFEEAVFAFVKALDPSAEVLFDHRIPDRDTGELRQCDVWINAKFRGHWPLSILVSCKDHRESGRKLHIGDIGTFCNEISSTGASTGVIYCNTGFSRPALKKAKANGIACCRLYEREAPDIPEVIWFEHFVCRTTVQLGLNVRYSKVELNTWNDFFNINIERERKTVLDVICEAFADDEKETISKVKKTRSFPPDWQKVLNLKIDKIGVEFQIGIFGRWKRYRARIEAIMLNGSYCFSNKSFDGCITGPLINLQEGHPGKDWVMLKDKETIYSSKKLVCFLYHGDVAAALREEYGPKMLNQRNRNRS